MKYKTFIYSIIFLTILQLFSPLMVNFSESGISIEKNIVNAQTTTDVFTPEPQIGYIKDYKVVIDGKTKNIPGIVFTYVDTLESDPKCYSTVLQFKIKTNFIIQWNDIIDSYSDCHARLGDWQVDKITTIKDGVSVKTRRQYYGTDINDFSRDISVGPYASISNFVINKDKKYGTDDKVITIEKTTKSFGPTPKKEITDVFAGLNDISEDALQASFASNVTSNAFLSETDESKIVGEFNIKIQNKGAIWQDIGNKNGEADKADIYGAWDSVYDKYLLESNGDAIVSNDIIPDNDGGISRFSSFDGFIFDISTDPKFKGKETMSININKLILEGKESGKLPLFNAGDINLKLASGFDPGKSILAIPGEPISFENGLEENTTYYYRIRIYPDNSREKFGLGSLGVPEDAYIAYSAQLNVPAKTSLNIIQDSRNKTSLLEASGQETQPNWMPSCEPGSPSTWFTGCLVVGFYHLVFVPTAYLLTVAGSIMDWVLLYSIKPDAYTVGYIKDSWRFVRDVMNLGFIFMLIYLAFKVMLGVGKGTKQLIVNTVIIATVINFSYPLATVAIDISNITARQLYYNAFNKKDGDGKPVGLSTMVAAGFNPQRLISGAGGQGNTQKERDNNKGTIFMIILMGVAFNIIGMLIFLKVALQFIYRILGLVFAIILSPVAIFSLSLAPETRSKLKMVGFEEWMSGLIKDSFKAPIFLFLILILALFVNNTPFANMFKDGVDGIDWWMSMLIPFMMIVGFLGLISKITKEMSSSLAEMAGGVVMKGIGAVAGVAMGGAALAGSSFIGKAATKLASSEMGQRIMDRAANGSFIAKAQTKILRKAQTGSFDLRQTGIGNAVSKETGANFNALTSKIDSVAGALGSTRGLSTGMLAGGYLADIDRKNKKNDEFVKMLEYNKSQISDAEDQKDSKEKEKGRLEDKEKEGRDIVKERERALRDSESQKKKIDEEGNHLAKIQELIGKRNDLTRRGLSTSEVDTQIRNTETKLNVAPGTMTTVNPATGLVNTTAIYATAKMANDPAKVRAQRAVDVNKSRLDNSKDVLTQTSKDIRGLDKEINALTKSIENIKNNRKNAFTQNVRNKSGHIYGRETYQSKMDAKVEAEPPANRAAKRAELEAEFTSTFGNTADEMRNVITSIDDRSNTTNKAYIRQQMITSTALGAAAGVMTSGLSTLIHGLSTGAIIGSGVAGGVVTGVSRSYQPGNESYGTSHTEWRPEVRDTYTPPTNS